VHPGARPATLAAVAKSRVRGEIVQELRYERPATVAEAVAAAGRDGARALAGGTDLIAQLKEGRRSASAIVDLKHVPELVAIAREADGGWRIGAAARVRSLAAHGELAREHAGLIASACLIGSLQIQSRASLGGNLCNAAPSADAVPLLIALGATVEIAGPRGRRTVAAQAIPVGGPRRTSLEPGEIVAVIRLPARASRSAARYLRFTPRREMDIAVAGSGVALTLGDDGRIAKAAVVLASVGPVPVVAAKAAAALMGERPTAKLFASAGAVAAGECKPISDTRGSADYRRELVAVLTRRVLTAAAQDLGISLS
jgi:carbon-monoxide dehydrogenase medium subunit